MELLDCHGYLHAVRKNRKRYDDYAGWMYQCRGGSCGGRTRTILYGTPWYNSKVPLKDHLYIIWLYLHVHPRVCCIFNCCFKLLFVTFNRLEVLDNWSMLIIEQLINIYYFIKPYAVNIRKNYHQCLK